MLSYLQHLGLGQSCGMQSSLHKLLAVPDIDCLQVYTAEEKAALAMYNFEENKKKEEKIIGDMQQLVQNTLGGSEDDSE